MKSFVVLGIGRFGYSLARTLYQLGHEVLAVDDNEDIIQDIADDVTHAVVGDCVDENTPVSYTHLTGIDQICHLDPREGFRNHGFDTQI